MADEGRPYKKHTSEEIVAKLRQVDVFADLAPFHRTLRRLLFGLKKRRAFCLVQKLPPRLRPHFAALAPVDERAAREGERPEAAEQQQVHEIAVRQQV